MKIFEYLRKIVCKYGSYFVSRKNLFFQQVHGHEEDLINFSSQDGLEVCPAIFVTEDLEIREKAAEKITKSRKKFLNVQ